MRGGGLEPDARAEKASEIGAVMVVDGQQWAGIDLREINSIIVALRPKIRGSRAESSRSSTATCARVKGGTRTLDLSITKSIRHEVAPAGF